MGFTQPVTEMSTRSRKMLLQKRAWPVRRGADCQDYGILNISQPYRLPWPVTGIAFSFYSSRNFCGGTFMCKYSYSVVHKYITTVIMDGDEYINKVIMAPSGYV
jgi:hypothetical protein